MLNGNLALLGGGPGGDVAGTADARAQKYGLAWTGSEGVWMKTS
jgi:hypothetical protein